MSTITSLLLVVYLQPALKIWNSSILWKDMASKNGSNSGHIYSKEVVVPLTWDTLCINGD
jgi:hypothetical protein